MSIHTKSVIFGIVLVLFNGGVIIININFFSVVGMLTGIVMIGGSFWRERKYKKTKCGVVRRKEGVL